MPLRSLSLALAAATALGAWSPNFHEAQTAMALGMVPKRMKDFMLSYAPALRDGARGVANDQVPAPEDIEAQFQRILTMSEEQRRPDAIVKELGTLAHMTQLLLDPSATVGVTPLRENFEAYGDEYLFRQGKNRPSMGANKEPFWAVSAPPDPRPQVLKWSELKYERHRTLLQHFDTANNRRIGQWGDLSVPFAQLQLSYSSGVNATANMWILVWRSVGEYWDLPQ